MAAILILKASKDICGDEIGLIQHHCQLLGMHVVVETIGSEQDLIDVVSEHSKADYTFDYIYLCSHGTKDGFDADAKGEKNQIRWSKFAQLLM